MKNKLKRLMYIIYKIITYIFFYFTIYSNFRIFQNKEHPKDLSKNLVIKVKELGKNCYGYMVQVLVKYLVLCH